MTNELLNMEQLEGIAGGNKFFDDDSQMKNPYPIDEKIIPLPKPYEDPKPIIPRPGPVSIPAPKPFEPFVPYPIAAKN